VALPALDAGGHDPWQERGVALDVGHQVKKLGRGIGKMALLVMAGHVVYDGPMRIIGLAGWSGAGKTTLVTRAIPVLLKRGVKVSTLKHAHHKFDVDQPGKDSYQHRMAGAQEVLVGSANRWFLLHELRGEREPTLQELLSRLSPVDLVIIEGYKRDNHPKLEVYRAANGKPLIHPDDPAVVAIATDAPLTHPKVPTVDLDDIETIVDILMAQAAPLDAICGARSADGAVE